MQEHEGNCSQAMRSEPNLTPSGKGDYSPGESWVGPFGLLSVRTPSGAPRQTQALSASCRDQPLPLCGGTIRVGLCLQDFSGTWLGAGVAVCGAKRSRSDPVKLWSPVGRAA